MKQLKKTQWLCAGVLCLLCGLFFLYLGKTSTVPLIYPDEAGYIGWARLLAGKPGNPTHYFPGYSVLLAPIFLFTNDILKAYPLIIILNGVLGAIIGVLLFRLSGFLCKRQDLLVRFGISLVATLYPSVVAYTQLGLCETWLQVLFLGMSLCVCALWEKRTRIGLWVLLAVLGIWATLTHPRGLMFCLGALVMALVLWRDYKKRLILGGSVCLVLIGVGGFLLLSDQSNVGAVHMLNQFRQLFHPKGMWALITTMISHFCYLVWATFGFLPVALWYGVTAIKKKERGWGLWVFLLSSFFFLWSLSAFYMSHHERSVHILYGRYLDVIVPSLLLAAFSQWGKRREAWWIWAVSAGAVVITGLLYGKATIGLDPGVMNAVGLYLYRAILHLFEFWWTALFFAVLTLGVVLAGKRYRSLSIWVVCGIFLFQIFFMKATYFEQEALPKRRPAELIRQLPYGAEVFVEDMDMRFFWPYHNYYVFRTDLVLSDQDEGQNFVLSWRLREEGTLIGMEKYAPMYLYSRKSLEEQLDYPGKLTEYNAKYHWRQTKEGVEVTVQNQGSPWLCLDAVRDVRAAVRLGVRQFDENQKMLSDQRYELLDNLYRGDQQTFLLSPGQQASFLEIQPVMEFTTWFSEGGSKVLILRKDGGKWVETVGQKLASDHSFRRVEFSHLHYADQEDNTSFAGNLINFYGSHTGADSTIQNIKMPGGTGVLVIETGEDRELTNVSVTLNGTVTIPCERFEQGNYFFPVNDVDQITSIQIKTDTYNPFSESGLPKWLSFLSLRSNLRPVQWMVHRVNSLLHREVTNYDFGLNIKAIEMRTEQD